MSPPTPTSSSWIRVTWIAFALALAAAGGFVAVAPRLQALGLAPKAFFLVLFPLGLAAAAFLFGALRSSARFVGNPYGTTLKLGGPVVVFSMVMVGGYSLTNPDTSFPLVVRVYGPKGETITEGAITIDFDADRKGPVPVTERGEAYFAVVPSAFIGREVRVHVDVPAYSLNGPASRFLDASSVLTLTLEKQAIARRKIAGLVEYGGGKKLPGARVTLPMLKLHADTNEDGYFELEVAADGLPETLLRVEKPGFLPVEQNVSVGNSELTLVLVRVPKLHVNDAPEALSEHRVE